LKYERTVTELAKSARNDGAERQLRIGVAGLGRAFMLMLPTFNAHPRIRLVAASDPRAEARQQFESDFDGRGHSTMEALCTDPDVDAIYIATPHQFHAEHVVQAARHGKHALVEKPMALTLAECATMIDATREAGVELIIGHSHSFDAPILRTRELISQQTYGAARMITALNYTDFLYRPRRPEELDTTQGGGVVFSQGAHQVDIVRLLAGGRTHSVCARTGAWDRSRPTEGAYSAQLTFDDGAFASLTYSGYAHFDSDELLGWIGELGHPKDPERYGVARAVLKNMKNGMSPADETELKNKRAYGAAQDKAEAPVAHNQFGMIIASCDRADLRPMPNGVMIYDDTRAWLDPLPSPAIPRAEVIDELCDAVFHIRAAIHTGAWAMATLEVCLGILESARSGKELLLEHQVGVPTPPPLTLI
jgi:phthalate 4,5-cis-dihydrodiol dehydrogenase